jgi:potassium-transporting ATPase KdpC subunit
VAGKWASQTKRNRDQVRKEIEEMLHHSATAPLAGLAGEYLVNVLEINLALKTRYEK